MNLAWIHYGGLPHGIPHIRDFTAKCEYYEVRKRKPSDFECESDGHYLCRECPYLTNAELFSE